MAAFTVPHAFVPNHTRIVTCLGLAGWPQQPLLHKDAK